MCKFCRPSDLSPCRSGMSASFFSFLLFLFLLPRGGGGYRHDDCFDDFDSTRMTMRILGSFCSLLFFDVQVLGKKKLLPCQVGGEFLFALVARPVHLHHARPQGPSGRSFFPVFLRFPAFVVSRKPGCVRSVWFFGLVAVSLFGVRAVCLGRFGGFSGCFFLACFVVLRSCIFSLGKEHPPARRPQWRLTPHLL